jgi:hypothetical protein
MRFTNCGRTLSSHGRLKRRTSLAAGETQTGPRNRNCQTLKQSFAWWRGPLQLSPIATTMTDDLDGSRIGAVKNETDHVTYPCERTPARNVGRATHSLNRHKSFLGYTAPER